MSKREELFAAIVKAFDNAGIKYGILNGVDPATGRLIGRDVDLILGKNQRGRALDLCWNTFEKMGWIIAKPDNPWPGCWSVFGYREAEYLELDLICALNWGPVILVDGPSGQIVQLNGYFFDPRSAVCKRFLMPILGGTAPKMTQLRGFESECLTDTCKDVFGVHVGRDVATAIRSACYEGVRHAIWEARRAASCRAFVRNPLKCIIALWRVLSRKIRSHVCRSAPMIDIGALSNDSDRQFLSAFSEQSIAGFPRIWTRLFRPKDFADNRSTRSDALSQLARLISAWWEQIFVNRPLSNAMVVVMNQGIVLQRLGHDKTTGEKCFRIDQWLPKADLSLWRSDGRMPTQLPARYVRRGWADGLIEDDSRFSSAADQMRAWVQHAFILRHSGRIKHGRSRRSKWRSAVNCLFGASGESVKSVVEMSGNRVPKWGKFRHAVSLVEVEFDTAQGSRLKKDLNMLDSTLNVGNRAVFEAQNPVYGRPAWIYSETAGISRRWIKAAWDARTVKLLEREIAVVRSVFGHAFKSLYGPEYLGSQLYEVRSWSLWRVNGAEPHLEGSTPKYLPLALIELASAEPIIRRPFVGGELWMSVLLKFPSKISRNEPHAGIIFERLLRSIASELEDISLPIGRSHGDVAPGNMLLKDRSVCLLNWEHSDLDWPLGLDLFDWMIRCEVAVGRTEPHQSYANILKSISHDVQLHYFMEGLNIPRKHMAAIFKVAILRRLYFAYDKSFDTYGELDHWLKLAFLATEREPQEDSGD